MDKIELENELNMSGKTVSVILTNECHPEYGNPMPGCVLNSINDVFLGKTIIFSDETKGCPGFKTGFGFRDGIPDIKGGFGYFLTCGRGEGYPPGERIKSSIDVAEKLLQEQPQNVLAGHKYIVLKPYEPKDDAAIVLFLVNPDQLSALVHLFNYRKPDYDNVIAPMTSGCASVFRIPLGEAQKEKPRAVIGNIDVFSRPHFPKDTFFFAVPANSFKEMLFDADESFLISPIWNKVRERVHHK
ncbi:DUF169 domain-containing protein [Methanolapillus ohkumae]|uniref:DUF169 domain-containing protein n=1 Tax=Methanolapillus ohkumae TaxID=3028298 RepID=A0AA96V8H2_9EURY|nr:hypothetical protein MsAm2_16040 [Methanosarcinaceae archaeon Am2]